MIKKNSLGLGGLGKAADTIRDLKIKSAGEKQISTGDTLVEIDLNLIDFDEEQYRQDKDDYDLEGLAQNIYEVGLTKLPSLEPSENGRWLITDGEMRTRAYFILRDRFPNDARWKKLPALSRQIQNLPGLDKRSTRDVIQLSANLFSDPGSVFDIADKLSQLETKYDSATVKKFMADIGQSNSKVEMSRWRAVAKVPDDVRVDVKANEIKDKETIATLAKIKSKNESAYRSIIKGYQEDSLPQALAKTVKQVWGDVKAGNKPAETSVNKVKVDKSTSEETDVIEQHKNVVEQEPSDSSSSSSKNDENALRLEATDINQQGNELVVRCAHGQVFRIAIPKTVNVSVKKG